MEHQEKQALLQRKEQLEKESLRRGNLDARADLWMRIFRGGMVFSSAIVLYSLVFLLMSGTAKLPLIVGVLLILLFWVIERMFRQRSQYHRRKKAELREEYVEVCDRLDQWKDEEV